MGKDYGVPKTLTGIEIPLPSESLGSVIPHSAFPPSLFLNLLLTWLIFLNSATASRLQSSCNVCLLQVKEKTLLTDPSSILLGFPVARERFE